MTIQIRTAATVLTFLVLLVCAPGAARAAPGTAPPPPRGAMGWPVQAQLLRPFVGPAETWGAGHRGVDLVAEPGAVVLAPEAGQVTFAGSVVDRGVLTLTHGSLRSSFEPVEPLVPVGQQVQRGEPIAVVTPAGAGHCTAGCLHWGVRRAGVYLDPAALVAGRRHPVLLPTLRPATLTPATLTPATLTPATLTPATLRPPR